MYKKSEKDQKGEKNKLKNNFNKTTSIRYWWFVVINKNQI
jgi:hypothetical protein